MSPSKPAETALLGLGSNLGDRAGQMAEALRRLHHTPGLRVVAVSSLYATAPVGVTDQPEFLNAAAKLRSELAPRELLEACLRVEAELGRVRGERWGPRIIDLDLLWHGGHAVREPALELPHPRMRERAFVLLPVAEIAPDRLLEGRPFSAWAAAAAGGGVRRLANPRLDLPS
ncbi:MAG TPA: 2-amino-4-hydroxy-6-hydroxymethyldihydropteridine diphosphokinase [Opitutaceae bacterium]|jgi:2-amino-4-hydroxy-6-hydroxymethyldihydropteridine diphosphokinase|nr:2-amino-4-hydroxy-6-hydroxymethyldihydropteridine diphosphokinase [Opitutaceae bacterium]